MAGNADHSADLGRQQSHHLRKFVDGSVDCHIRQVPFIDASTAALSVAVGAVTTLTTKENFHSWNSLGSNQTEPTKLMKRKRKNKVRTANLHQNKKQAFDLENLPKFRATIEAMSTASFREHVKSADLIMTHPTSPEWNPQIAYGVEALQSVVSTNSTTALHTLCIIIDWTTKEPEYLVALLRHIKGKCDFDAS